MSYLVLSKSDRLLFGDIFLDGSKSLSNRALIIRALCNEPFEIKNLSTSEDTRLLQQLLYSDDETLDAGMAGTTFRFLTAYLAITTDRPRILTGTERMKSRPVDDLVTALRQLGADIVFLENQGYPPLRISPAKLSGAARHISISAETSSQFVTALLLIAPTLPGGLTLELQGAVVSWPYVEMTLRLMQHFGVSHTQQGNLIRVPQQTYLPKHYEVEADWSAAAYFFSMAALSESCDLRLHGLHQDSLQGDAVVVKMMEHFGVQAVFEKKTVRISRSEKPAKPMFEQDFRPCPDLAQTMAVLCGALGVQGLFSGLETLPLKETDRIAAVKAELKKVGVSFSKLPAHFSKKQPDRTFFMIDGKAAVEGSPAFSTYNDHRMAMSLAPLAMLGEINIEYPEVVEKSYPDFWKDLGKLGFRAKRCHL